MYEVMEGSLVYEVMEGSPVYEDRIRLVWATNDREHFFHADFLKNKIIESATRGKCYLNIVHCK